MAGSLDAMPDGKCHIGTSGWSYSHWARGRFYPRGLKPGQWLAYYAERFDTVEINASFYRLPWPEYVTGWRETAGSKFRFAVKLWRRITHDKRLSDCADALERFFQTMNLLGPKKGPLLVQLPPSLRKDVDRLSAFLALLKRTMAGKRWKVAVEFRHPEWLCPQVYRLLDRHKVAVCLADMKRCPIIEPNEAPFVYVRRHGPGGRYRGCYAEEHIAEDAERIRGWLAEGRDVYVYYNNDVEGYAVDNAQQLAAALGLRITA